MLNHPITFITSSPTHKISHHTLQSQQNLLPINILIKIDSTYILNLKPCPLHVISATVVILSIIYNKCLLNSKIQVPFQSANMILNTCFYC